VSLQNLGVILETAGETMPAISTLAGRALQDAVRHLAQAREAGEQLGTASS
jgi:predicted transcriptional regulator